MARTICKRSEPEDAVVGVLVEDALVEDVLLSEGLVPFAAARSVRKSSWRRISVGDEATVLVVAAVSGFEVGVTVCDCAAGVSVELALLLRDAWDRPSVPRDVEMRLRRSLTTGDNLLACAWFPWVMAVSLASWTRFKVLFNRVGVIWFIFAAL